MLVFDCSRICSKCKTIHLKRACNDRYSIYNFHKSFRITEIKKLAFHLPHVCILGTHHCGNTCCEAFRHHAAFEYFLSYCDYAEKVVAIFSYQIKSWYYGVDISVSIEGVALDNFSASTQSLLLSAPKSRIGNSLFH